MTIEEAFVREMEKICQVRKPTLRKMERLVRDWLVKKKPPVVPRQAPTGVSRPLYDKVPA
jgi:hypothetical protein